MSLVSLPVFLSLVAVAGVFWAVPARARVWVLVLAGIAFAVTQATVFVALYLVLAGTTLWVSGALGRRRAEERPVRAGFVAMLGLLVANLLAWKLFEIPAHTALLADPDHSRSAFPGYAGVFVPVGLSFLTFRLIHLLVERTRRRSDVFVNADAPGVLAWLLFPPLLIAGPLQRYDSFTTQLTEAVRPRLPDLNAAALRICSGLVKKLAIADTLGNWAQPMLMAPEATSPGMLLLAVYAASFQLYMDFSGYSDVAIGLGRLFGLKVPENFDWPILCTDIAAFWRKWHITLHHFFRDYVFLPLFGVGARPLKVYLGVLTTIFLFQIWHQLSPAFLFLGVYHGLGVIGVQAFQRTRRRWPRLHRVVRKVPAPVAIAITYTWFSVGNIVFMSDPAHMLRVLQRLFWLG